MLIFVGCEAFVWVAMPLFFLACFYFFDKMHITNANVQLGIVIGFLAFAALTLVWMNRRRNANQHSDENKKARQTEV